MPDENINSTDVLGALEYLEDYSLDNKSVRLQNYRVIHSALEREGHVDVNILERILAVCVHDLKEDMKYTFVVMKLIPVVLRKIKNGSYQPPVDLVPSALAVINILNTTGLLNKVDTLKAICYDTLLSYPDATLIAIVENVHTEVLTILNLYCHERIPMDMKLQACNFLHKLLKILPPEKKRTFIGLGISVWFSKIIPTAMAHLVLQNADHEMTIEILELLTEDLIHFDYANDKLWVEILECICRPDKYPLIMQNMLEGLQQHLWDRLWIVFIKLLKHQITQPIGSIGTPINSMLPVVEAAFKVDVANRCKAFECWNVLIDSFSTETNESNIVKRIKLLVIPLKSNNAKTEETALAKFKCWWHLIVKFQSKMDRFLDIILVSFLHFIFGKHNATDKPTLLPGQITIKVKKHTVPAIVEMLGHVDCSGCTDLQRLNRKIITPKHLVDNWRHWIYSLSASVMIAAKDEDVLTKQHIKCLWKSFILTIGELPDNSIRKDLFYEILSVLRCLIQQSEGNSKLADIVFNVLFMSLFDGDPTIKVLLKTIKGDNNPMNETLDILQEHALRSFYKSHEKRELVTKLKHITNLVVNKHFNPTYVVGRFLLELPATDTALTLWTALAESVYENERMCVKNLITMLMWPLENLDLFSDVKLAALAWHRLYLLVHPKLNKTAIEEDIMNILLIPENVIESVVYFRLSALLAVMKCKFADEQFTGSKEIELLKSITSSIQEYKSIEQLFPILIDVLTLVLRNVTVNVNETLASHALICFKSVMKVAMQGINNQCNDLILTSFGHILKYVDKLFNINSYSKLSEIITDDLIQHLAKCRESCSIKPDLLGLLNKIMQQNKDNNEALFSKIKTAINNLENVASTDVGTNETQENVNVSVIDEFNTPSIKQVPKKSKKKEPSIVNTVSENGEEYVVVKSNWKFNPRKLTENQKERLKRKREDIPALYQDLSQSQDEFQLASWKTDSQDTSSSRSESRSNAPTNEDATTILKNLPSSDVVPTILDNIYTKDKNDYTNNTNIVLPKDVPNRTEPVTPKNTKSPRMALKDRVFRNVRNLIEKSSLQKENKESEEQDKSENTPKTPVPAKMDLENNKTEPVSKTPTANKVKNTDSVMNSAPPLISADRPSRVKRKPKKFDDVELLALKKSRHSLQVTPSDAKTVQTAAIIHSCRNIDEQNDKVLNDADNVAKENDPITPVVDKNGVIQENEDLIVNDTDITDKNTNKVGNEQVNVEVINEKAQDDNVAVFDNTTKDVVVTKCDILHTDKGDNKISEKPDDTGEKIIQDTSTPKQSNAKDVEGQRLTAKKSSVKKSRIEKELAIDMVEGHPFLKMNSDKRLTRKAIASPQPASGRRKGLAEKLNKSKSDSTTPAKSDKKIKSKKDIENVETSFTVNETQDSSEASRGSTPEDPCSEDVIESSQDSTFSTLSVKSAKKTQKKNPVVSIEKLKPFLNNEGNVSQSILDCGVPIAPVSPKANYDTKDDSELPLNKTAVEDKSFTDLTENMDTEPINEADICEDVIIIDAVPPPPFTISSDDTIGPETQEMAEADTQTVNPTDYMCIVVPHDKPCEIITIPDDTDKENNIQVNNTPVAITGNAVTTQNDVTITLSESTGVHLENITDVSSPFKDDVERNKDFLNNTLEISPIKTMSPDRDKKSPSPETSSDYVVIKLTSPVHSNGEPFEKCASPEFFSNDKVSPDKRDQSPPRVEITVTNTSPSSLLSLKKNRPQVRPGGRAAQMLGLCVPGNLNTINPERSEPEENKKCSPSSTAARRNLRILYNSVHNDNNDEPSESDDSGSFLKFKKTLPAVDSSPSGPILKRKHVEITDDATISPASKRKRVSFHDPPVSTTISVHKYIEPGGLRSPQNSAQKRLERQMRQFIPVKSPKRLENVFRLDSALTKTLESFTEVDVNTTVQTSQQNTTDDTQQSSLDDTPSVEIVKASELNDCDPICPDLLECKDPIDNIATELSSPAMKSLLIKELEGKVETVGDLAKMTELEVNRLCIKAPKVKIAKKVLTDYAASKAKTADPTVTIDAAMFDETMNEAAPKAVDMEIQTDCKVVSDMDVQTTPVPVTFGSMQTDIVPTSHLSVQTDETGEGSTADIINSCLLKRSDFVEELTDQLQLSSIQQMSEKLPFSVLTDLLMKKVTPLNSDPVLSRLLKQLNTDAPSEDHTNNELTFLQDFICDRFDSKDLILFCSQLLRRVHDKPA